MFRSSLTVLVPAVWIAVAGLAPVRAQSVISAHSGVVQYIEGDVAIDGEAIHPKFAEFPDVKNGQVIATGEGRAEVLLTPGVFLRIAENSSVKMVSNALSDTRVELLSGSALIEVGELLNNNSITVLSGGASVALPKKGLFRFDAQPNRVRVYDGQAKVAVGDKETTLKKGREADFDSAILQTANFDIKETDAFYRWSARRESYVAAANVTSAKLANSSYSSGFYGGQSMWSWNPYFGMFTFIPGTGIYQSPFGSPFYSPSAIGFYVFPGSYFRYGFTPGPAFRSVQPLKPSIGAGSMARPSSPGMHNPGLGAHFGASGHMGGRGR